MGRLLLDKEDEEEEVLCEFGIIYLFMWWGFGVILCVVYLSGGWLL